MNITTNAGLSLKLASEKCFPAGSGSWKSGAAVPSGSMVEGVKAMRIIWNPPPKMSDVKISCPSAPDRINNSRVTLEQTRKRHAQLAAEIRQHDHAYYVA